MRRLSNYIAGASVAPKSGKYVELINPSTGEAFVEMPVSDAADIDAAGTAAAAAFESWRRTTPSQRQRYLLAIADAALQATMVERIVGEDLSVRSTEDVVRKTLAPLAAVPTVETVTPAGEETPAPPRLRPVPDASVAELEHLLEDYLSTRVHVDLKGRNGKIVIDFADLDDLERIYLTISKPR